MSQDSVLDINKELGDRIIDAAKTGGRNGFVIKMGRKTGRKIRDPLSEDGKGEEDEIVFDTSKTYHRHSISTQDYKRYTLAKEKLANETDENKRNDLVMRLYEYLALKFLAMSHEEFVKADFDDVVVATLACDALFGVVGGGGNTTTNPPPAQQPLVRKSTTRSHYKAPDEE
jgi:hypothetical protein